MLAAQADLESRASATVPLRRSSSKGRCVVTESHIARSARTADSASDVGFPIATERSGRAMCVGQRELLDPDSCLSDAHLRIRAGGAGNRRRGTGTSLRSDVDDRMREVRTRPDVVRRDSGPDLPDVGPFCLVLDRSWTGTFEPLTTFHPHSGSLAEVLVAEGRRLMLAFVGAGAIFQGPPEPDAASAPLNRWVGDVTARRFLETISQFSRERASHLADEELLSRVEAVMSEFVRRCEAEARRDWSKMETKRIAVRGARERMRADDLERATYLNDEEALMFHVSSEEIARGLSLSLRRRV